MKALSVFLACVLICSLLCSCAASAEDVRPYMPRLGQYQMENVPGDYVTVYAADTKGIVFTVVWSGIYSMRNVSGSYSTTGHNHPFTYYDGAYTITGSVFIDGVVLYLELDSVTGSGDLATVLANEGYFNTNYTYVFSSTEVPVITATPKNDSGSSSGSKYLYLKDGAERVNVRSGPGLSYSDIGSITSGQSAPYLNQSKRDDRGVTWYKIRWRGGTGWVSSKYAFVSSVPNTRPVTAEPSAGSTLRLKDGAERVNVRSGPGLSYSDIGSLTSGQTARYLNQSSRDDRGVRWYKIRWQGGTGWVSSKYAYID